MPLVDALLPEFDREMTTTRRLLERVPDDRFDWKPHERSMTLGALAAHVANLAWWGEVTLDRSGFDLAAGEQRPAVRTRGELLAAFDRNVAATRARLAGRSDAELLAPWSLKQGDRALFTMPKAAVWRSFVMNHLVHHRGQLAVYLRLQDVPVPAIYGPSADEAA